MPESPARLRVLIVDDEPPARRRIRHLLKSDPRIEIVGEAGNGPDAVEAILQRKTDLVFLDIQIPEMDGFEVIRTVGRELMPAIIFVTAFDQFAVRAFEVHALDYLLKPFVVDRFRAALDRAIGRIRTARLQREDSRKVEILLRDFGKAAAFPERFLVKSGEKLILIKTADIRRIEAAEKYVVLHGETARHMVRDTMTAMAAKLDPRKFLRVHRSHIVNVEAIREVQPLFHGEAVLILKNSDRVPLSRTYREKFEAAFIK
jgi:two-component system LytT family response regulator